MKLLTISLTLFLFFVGVLSGVRYLDHESALYASCVKTLADRADSPFIYPADAQAMIAKLENPEAKFEVGGKTCPVIYAAHKDELKARFEAASAG